LKELIGGMETIKINADPEAEIWGISFNSKEVKEGDIFVAIKGLHTDGHNYIGDAIGRGAVAVISERDFGGPIVVVKDSRDALAYISNNFYGRPSEKMSVIGVTGTNGKTTTAFLIREIIEHSGRRAGLIGTISYKIGGEEFPSLHTTPEAPEYQALLAKMLNAGCLYAVSEVSSHALAQKRADYTRFTTAVFTNLTRDHLDFHITMENYFEAKKRLFYELLKEEGTAIINLDDPYGRALRDCLKNKHSITYAIDSDSDATAYDIINKPDGLRFKVRYRGIIYLIESPLVGIPNVYNILASVCAAISLGIDKESIFGALRRVENIRGRFERVSLGQDFLCVIDYAHSEDALRRLILTARDFTEGRIITVFGCGGDRDRGKRPLMGKTATDLSDMVFITSDNPRTENPEAIIKEIEEGCTKKNYKVVIDRKDAIYEAIAFARKADTVLIAGKGHEDYQEIDGIRHHFSDKEIAIEAIRTKIGGKD